MSLIIRSSYPSYIYVSLMWYNPVNCPREQGGTIWNSIGWYEIPPGGQRTVWNGSVRNVNRWWGYYAEAADGLTWTGNIRAGVSNQAFRFCVGDTCGPPPCRQAGFRELDVNNFDNYTLTLTG
jgi:uncharacterized membrane protein